jgi:protein-S-isoprenylcysteine O-methyltransferase Ste14
MNRNNRVQSIQRGVRRWFASTPNRTFVVYPVAVLAFELGFHRGHIEPSLWGLPLLIWGHLQYRLIGRYRRHLGGGGPGTEVPPLRLVTSGPYRYTRNPMYLGHLIFLLGIVLTLRSWAGLMIFALTALWFHRRVLRDEARLESLFGPDYAMYRSRVARWIPAIA